MMAETMLPRECSSNRSLSADDAARLFRSRDGRDCGVRVLCPEVAAQRSFLVAAGLEQALTFLENLRVTPKELEWVSGYGAFRPAFVRYLENLRFTGDVHAMPEGTTFFPNEPILRVTAPLPQAQLVGKPVDQPAPLSDLNRLQGSSFGFGSAEQAVGGFRPAPRPWG